MQVAREYVVKGGVDYARKFLVGAFGPEQAKKSLDRVIKLLNNEVANFAVLQEADPQQLAKFVHSEHPQTIALILSHLNPSQAAGLLFSLPPEMRGDVALRMANLDQISPEVISKIAGVIGAKLKALGGLSRESCGGVHAVSEMLNRLDSNTSKEILESIESQDPNLVETPSRKWSARSTRRRSPSLSREPANRCGHTCCRSCRSAAPRCSARTWRRSAR